MADHEFYGRRTYYDAEGKAWFLIQQYRGRRLVKEKWTRVRKYDRKTT